MSKYDRFGGKVLVVAPNSQATLYEKLLMDTGLKDQSVVIPRKTLGKSGLGGLSRQIGTMGSKGINVSAVVCQVANRADIEALQQAGTFTKIAVAPIGMDGWEVINLVLRGGDRVDVVFGGVTVEERVGLAVDAASKLVKNDQRLRS